MLEEKKLVSPICGNRTGDARKHVESLPVAAAFPYNPPIAIPNNALTAKNCSYVLQNPVPSSSTINSALLTMNGHLRPYRSAANPKMILPTDRNMSTRVIPQVISAFVLPNVSARFSTVSETVKKSKASHDQAKKATRKNIHCCRLSIRRSVMGLETLSCAGLSVVSRVVA